MKTIELLKPSPLYLEIGHHSMRLLDGEVCTEFPLEREGTGRLTVACVERLTSLFKERAAKNRLGRRRAFCALGARGFSLRRIAAPPRRENFQQLVALQIEREFPLAPDELAWGIYERPLSPAAVSQGPSELVVVAVKREAIEEYSRILSGCGLDPVFTLGALSLPVLCPSPPRSYAVLEIRQTCSELVLFEDGLPALLRILPVGGADLTQALSQALGISRDEVEKLRWEERLSWPGASTVQSAIEPVAQALAGSVKSVWAGHKIYLSGEAARIPGLADAFAQALGPGAQCQRIEAPPGHSAALLGIRQSCQNGRRIPPLVLQSGPTERASASPLQPEQWKWAATAALFLLVLVGLRYAEPVLKGSGLSQRLHEIKAATMENPEMESELSFLQFMETNRPPYLEVLAAVGDGAARGTRIESLTMSRRGELSFRGTMQNSQQATDLRAKLIASGLFSRVVLEEQTPTQDRRVQVRISARWLPVHERRAGAGRVSE